MMQIVLRQIDETFDSYYKNFTVEKVTVKHYWAREILCVFEILHVSSVSHNPVKNFEIPMELVRTVQLEDLLGKPYYTLSCAQKVRVRLLCIILKKCSILIADELTTGLDAYTATSLIALVHQVTCELNLTAILALRQPSQEMWRVTEKSGAYHPYSSILWTHFAPIFNSLFMHRKSIRK